MSPDLFFLAREGCTFSRRWDSDSFQIVRASIPVPCLLSCCSVNALHDFFFRAIRAGFAAKLETCENILRILRRPPPSSNVDQSREKMPGVMRKSRDGRERVVYATLGLGKKGDFATAAAANTVSPPLPLAWG